MGLAPLEAPTMAGTPFQESFADGLPLGRLLEEGWSSPLPPPPHPLDPSGEGRGKAETKKPPTFKMTHTVGPRALPEANASQLLGWLLLPPQGPSQEGGAPLPASQEPQAVPGQGWHQPFAP